MSNFELVEKDSKTRFSRKVGCEHNALNLVLWKTGCEHNENLEKSAGYFLVLDRSIKVLESF